MTNFIYMNEEQTANLEFDIADASDLRYEEISIIIEWADAQDPRLFEDLNLQELLNLYRISVDRGDIDNWFEEDPEGAVVAYNSAVNPDNVLRVSKDN